MAAANQSLRPLAICSRCLGQSRAVAMPMRSFSAVSRSQQPEAVNHANSKPLIPTDQLDPSIVYSRSEEHRLMRDLHVRPVGSRRRRMALALSKDTGSISFDQLPYQCFQEARNVLTEDRKEKLADIEKMRKRIANLEAQDVAKAGGEPMKQHRLASMRRELENLKILADVNDPVVKRRFEDGLGDMNKPIYRHLALKKWHSMKRKVLMQRITQMHVTPDVLPAFEPVLDMDISWHTRPTRPVPPGDFVPTTWLKQAPSIRLQKFDKGVMRVTIVAVDSDVPNTETDSFESRCHGIWSNIEIAPDRPYVGDLGTCKKAIMREWTPPTAQRGTPYHRISFLVFAQPADKTFTPEENSKLVEGAGSEMWLRGFAETTKMKPVGVGMFRIKWDEEMQTLMQELGINEADVELRRAKPEKLPMKDRVKDGLRYRGWKK